MSATPHAPAPSELPHCTCGFDRHHAMARPEPKYRWGSWLRLMVGVSARPERVAFRCRRCNAIIEETSAPEVLERSY